MINNTICKILGIKYPLIQAPMNWINNAEMVAAVSNAGALGVLRPNAGPKEIDGRRIRTEERLSIELSRVRQLTSAPVGINIFRELEQKSGSVDWQKQNRHVWFVLFSSAGFTEELKELAAERDDLLLFDETDA